MPGIVRRALEKLRNPAETSRALQLQAEIVWITLRNRFGSSAVATGGPGAIVSLTTYDKRIDVVHLAIESIARGEVKPSRLILWLDDKALFDNPPEPLQRLKKRGLEIRLCKNYGPHKKYYPYVEGEEVLVQPLATADDDVIYPKSWLAGLIAANHQFPNCVNCYRARTMMLSDGGLAPYRDWPLCETASPELLTMSTGVSGTIYPPTLLQELKRAGSDFESRCPRNDDLWLHVWTIRSNFEIRQIQREALHFPHIPGSQVTSLFSENCTHDDGNDRQIAATYEPDDIQRLNKAVAVRAKMAS